MLLPYVRSISKKVVLIDKEQFANFMIDYNMGVSTTATFELKKIDNDYFGESISISSYVGQTFATNPRSL
jgi:hypothetical protein